MPRLNMPAPGTLTRLSNVPEGAGVMMNGQDAKVAYRSPTTNPGYSVLVFGDNRREMFRWGSKDPAVVYLCAGGSEIT